MLRGSFPYLGRRLLSIGFAREFDRVIQKRSLLASPVQKRVVGKLDDLLSRLQDGMDPKSRAKVWAAERHEKQIKETTPPSFLSYLKPTPVSSLVEEMPVAGPPPITPYATNGLYIYGPVGQGKTMLLDAFHDYIRELFPEEASVRQAFSPMHADEAFPGATLSTG